VERSWKILHLEDSQCDMALAQAALVAEGIDYEPIVAVNREEFSVALAAGGVDLIISDYTLPAFDGLTALAMTRALYPDLPFIFFTGTMAEEKAIASLKSGATDYVLKGRLTRLGQIVRRALQSQEDQLALRQAADSLRRENERFRVLSKEFKTLLDAIPDKITLRSPDFKLIWANKRAVDALNRGAEVVDRHCFERLHSQKERCEHCPAVASFRTGKSATAVITTADKSLWELRTVPICDAGSVISVIEIARDISEQRRLEERCLQAQKLEIVGTLASGIAHDFNNILTCINGYGLMLSRNTAEDDPQRTYINKILDASARAAKLTSELLQFSKKQPGQQTELDLNNVIKAAEKFVQRVFNENIDVRIKLPEEPLPLWADGHHLEQVLMNLATNARDAMAKDEKGCYTITADKVTLSGKETSSPPGAYALLTVSDTGEGMEPVTQQRIFEPFFTTREVGKGSGLGLAAVYGIIKQHGGEISVSSRKNQGTTFTIYLPLLTTATRNESGATPGEAPCGGAETILLAEDDALVRAMATTFLTDYGYTVLAAENGEAAVQLFLQNQDNIDLLLFDLLMPKMNGLEACKEIQKVRPGIKALIASGYLPEAQALDTGPGDRVSMVAKPYNPATLLQKVRSLLDMA
jgi:signal transduction histidine kinase/DNA-binding response OmpR family regulator